MFPPFSRFGYPMRADEGEMLFEACANKAQIDDLVDAGIATTAR
jgi:hypothetical protein